MKNRITALSPHLLNGLWLLLAWGIAIVLVNPVGEFPLNDDWAFSRNVYSWVVEGRLEFDDWMTMTLLVHFLWGSLFCKIFGFSFTVLRISTLVLAVLGSYGVYLATWEMSRNRRIALLAALLLAFNPLYFSLAFTYMTDVPFLVFFSWSIFFLNRALRDDKTGDLILGTLFAVLAVLIRQFALLLPLAFGLAVILKQRNLKAFAKALIPLLLTAGAMKAGLNWLESLGNNPLLGKPTGVFDLLRSVDLFQNFYWRADFILLYLGLFLLPLLVLVSGSLGNTGKLRKASLWLAFSLLVVLLLLPPVWSNFPMGNIWNVQGIGPMVLKDTHWGINVKPLFSSGVTNLIRSAAVIGAVCLVFRTFRNLAASRKEELYVRVFALTGLIIYGSFLLVNIHLFDRYLLPLLPLWLPLVIGPAQKGFHKASWAASMLMFVLMAGFSIAGTHDNLSWNRARWKGIDQLMTSGNISRNQIDGGFEFNGWHRTHPQRIFSHLGISWWFVDDDEYAVSYGRLGCYESIAAYAYHAWLPPRVDTIYMNRRIPFRATDTLRCDAETLSPDSLHFLDPLSQVKFGNVKQRDSTRVHSGSYSLRTDPKDAFGFTLHLDEVQACERFQIRVWRHARFDVGRPVVSAPDPKVFYLSSPIEKLQKEEETGWVQLELAFTLPDTFKGNTLKIYLWNPGKEVVWFDDLEIVRMSY